MSFEIVCSGCGAPSSPSVGMCPFCKTVMAAVGGKDKQTLAAFNKLYQEGRLDRALALGNDLFKSKPALKENIPFVLSLVKVLLESEGPSTRINGMLAEAYMQYPENAEITEYMEIMDAKNSLKKGVEDVGEQMLKAVLRRSPNNFHAHFILGTHMFWQKKEVASAIPHLESCVRLHPNFLRAWACLGAIYKQMGNAPLAQRAFAKCAQLETHAEMKQFFTKQSKAA